MIIVASEKGKKMKKSDNDLIRVRNVKALFESYLTTLRSADYYSDSEKACISGVLSVMQSDIMDLPTIEQPTWISCAERLPGKSGTYIVRSESGAVYTSHFYAEKLCASGYTRAACWTKRGKKKVLDWMPLPPKGG